ncbi:MAG: sulfatase [Acidobacteria bacterium]|nr:sulfatase [Acidobacteriota bacterium]MBI3279868.1 sulfatase [Acidobacteriota bacterium]
MNRRQLLGTALSFPAILRARQGSPADRPNILWILAEDLGPELACYGFPLVETPNLDRLAGQGIRFTRAFVTAPVCSASRSAFNVGLYQTTTGTHHHRSHRADGYQLPEGAQTACARLHAAGYFTANVLEIAPGVSGTGKTDWNWNAPKKPFDGTHWNQRKPGQPFYAQINFRETHKGPAFKEARQQKKLINPEKVPLPPYWPDHPVVRDEFANYLDCVNLLDRKVGAVLDALEREKLAENTVVFFMGDHGRCLIRGKQWCYDAGLHVPMFLRWPGVTRAATLRDDPVLSLDMTATTLAAAGLPLPARRHGRPLIGNGAAPRDFIVGARDRCDMTVDRIRCVRDRRYKYIRNFMPERPYTQYNQYIEKQYPTLGVLKQLHAQGKLKGSETVFMAERKPEVEFYDTQADPHEVNNLAAAPEHHRRIGEMSLLLERWIKETDDQGRFPEAASAQSF